MFDLNDILDILKENEHGLSLHELTCLLCRKYKYAIDIFHYSSEVKKILDRHKNKIRLNYAGLYESSDSNDYLLVSEHKYFRNHNEVFNYVCNFQYGKQQCYFNNFMNGIDVWFPKSNSSNWKNTLNEDGTIFSYQSNKGNELVRDSGKRFIFLYEKKPNGGYGYRFIGLFEPLSNDGKIAKFKLIDDKVKLAKSNKPLIICAISYLKNYDGVIDDEFNPRGSYGTISGDANEKKNFLIQADGLIHGFVETKETVSGSGKYNTISLENISNRATRDTKFIYPVDVIFVAKKKNMTDFVIVGWYKNATVYRDRIVNGNDISMMTCQPEDAHLIPHSERNFLFPDGHGTSFGIGTSNFYYIQGKIKDDAVANEYYKKVLDYTK